MNIRENTFNHRVLYVFFPEWDIMSFDGSEERVWDESDGER